MDKSVFLDTAYIMALIRQNDKHHSLAIEISKQIKAEKIQLITTEAILIEAAGFLAKVKFRNKYSITVNEIRKNVLVEKIIDESLHLAWSMYEKMFDKEWSLTDCYSFVAMKKYDLKQALTTDKHFEQAGFERLLKQWNIFSPLTPSKKKPSLH